MDGFTSTKNLVYIILPLLIVLVIVSLALTFHIRQRRAIAASASYPALRRESDGPLALPHHHLRHALGAVRSTEGLNELGEAPPPYDRKKEAAAGEGADHVGGIRLRDLEEGHASPPEYIMAPQPVLARERV